MTLFDFLPHVQHHPLFTCVGPQILLRYFHEEILRVQEFISGEMIRTPEDPTNEIGILISGTAQVHAISGGENALLKNIRPGEIFGVANLYAENHAFPSIITAKSHCAIVRIEASVFQRYVESEPAARNAYFSFLSNKIVYLNQKIAIFTAGSAEKRLTFFLLENESQDRWTMQCSMSTLAELLGIGRASLYRAMDRLIATGWISRSDKNIWIRDKAALKDYLSKGTDGNSLSC